MKKEIIVINLGGSQIIVNNEINVDFLLKFKSIINKYSNKYKFIIVCGGGSFARVYINSLKKVGASEKLQSLTGISITRHNARFMSYFFGFDNVNGIPYNYNNIKQVESMLKKQDVIFCGALEYHPNQTSDATSAQIASYFKSIYINITNVSGLFDKDPTKFRNAKLIKTISWRDFNKIASKIKLIPGQHFVIDSKAANIMMKNKIKTYIIGKDLKNLVNILNNKNFNGTLISD